MTGTRVLTLVLVTAVGVVVADVSYDHTICRSTKKGKEYVGTVSETVSGRQCQRWDTDNSPHSMTYYSDSKFPDGSKTAAENYCRNPDSESGGPWCYTTDPSVRWETCDTKHCFGWVSSVEPRYIGTGGSVKVTLYGEGFADNQFNFGADSNLGNKVWFVNEYESVECESFPDGSNEEMVQCYSPEGMYDSQWKVRLSVDGVETPTDTGICNGNPDSWSCSVRAASWWTPNIDQVVPRSGLADGIITIWGRFFSDLYGSNAAQSSNGKTAQVLRVYVDGQPCELKDGDDFYGLQLTSGDYGYVKCKASLGAAFSGNVSVIIDAPYGRTSVEASGYQLDGMGKVHMYQTYAAIDSLSATSGSVNGGQLLTINGRFFDETDAPADVKVGGEVCTVVSLTSEEITCRTPEEPAETRSSYPGNRGMRHAYFNTTTVYHDDLETLRDRQDQDLEFWSHSAYWCETYSEDCHVDKGTDRFNVRSRGYIIPQMSGEYQLLAKADDSVKVFMGNDSDNTTLIISLESYTQSYYWSEAQASEIMNLTAGTPYYVETFAREHTSNSYVYLALKYLKPDLVERISGKVEPAVKTYEISSTEDKEAMTVKLDLAAGTAVSEVQQVTMTYSSVDSLWQLGMQGVYTDILDVDTSALDLETAINDLASVYPDRVQVSASEITNGREFTITFDSELGNWPRFTKKEAGGASVSISDITDGVASLSEWRLHLEHEGSNLLSDVVDVAIPSEEQMEETVQSLFTARCPRSIGETAKGKYFYEGLEDKSSPGYYGGNIDYESEPFCGIASGMNVGRLYDSYDIDVTAGGYICFAYRGEFRNIIRIQTRTSVRHSNIYPEHPFAESADGTDWFYQCIDILAYMELYYPGEAPYRLTEFEVYRWSHNDIWVDEVVIAGAPTTANNETVITDRRIPLPARVAEVDVEQNGSVYDITIEPYNCANTFQMVRLYLAPVSGGNTGTGSSSASYGDSGGDWPVDASVDVDRTSKASVPVTGTFDLTSPQATIAYAADIEPEVLQNRLVLDHELDDVKVTRSGSCYGYKHNLEFTRTTGGNVPTMSGDGSALSGNNPMFEVIDSSGFILYDPIPGDMVVTAEPNAQVTVSINNIYSKCSGNCSYSWSLNDVPTVTACSPASGSVGAELTITGTKFSTTATENMVMVGPAKCVVSSSTATEIKCDLLAGTIGTYAVVVKVDSLGKADSTATFSYDSGSITDVSPVKGSTAGGTSVTITGSGFADGSTVTIDGNDCPVISLVPSEIVCESPSGSGSVDVEVVSTQTFSCSGCFTFSAGDTLTVTSFSPSLAMAAGGEELTLDGTFPGIADLKETMELYLLDSAGEMTSLAINWTSTDVSAIVSALPPLSPGDYTITVQFDSEIGLAAFSSTPTLTVNLDMDFLTVKQGSFEGETRLGISGTGFGTDKDMVKVMVGESACEVTELSNTEIICYTGRGSKTYNVTNGGIHPVFGLGYAWSPPISHIMAGDRIRFIWTSPPFVTSNDFKVMEAPNADDPPDGTGFDSGAGSPTGEYTHQFDTAGTYYYTSGVVGTNENIEMRGLVEVSDKVSFSADVSVWVNGIEAAASSGGSVDESGLACQGTTAEIAGMSESDPSMGGDFEFSYMISYTPVMTAQDVDSGYIDTDITITGDGFSTTACENEVMIGDYTCMPSQQTATQIVCAPDVTEEPDVGISFPVTVRVNNRGKALNSMPYTFAILPSMDTVSPATGSTHGGTNITIAGSGFVGETEVMLGLVSCNIMTQTYTEIVCLTGPSSDATNDVTVTVTNSLGTLLPVACPTSDCTFEHATSSTPIVNTVDTPSDNKIRDASTTITATGSSFGTDASAVTVMIGDMNCAVTSLNDTNIVCELGPLPKGNHDLAVHVVGKGLGVGPTLSSVFSVDTIMPSSGSTHGGQLVTIAGNGMRPDDSYVTINSVTCEIEDISITEIVCRTGASAEGTDLAVIVGVGSTTKTDLAYNYSSALTPEVSSISPAAGTQGDTVTISGTGFSATAADNEIMIGGVNCTVTSSSSTSVSCTLGGSRPGVVSVMVDVAGLGYSNSDVTFTYELSPGSLSQSSGSFGGGQDVTLDGSGFIDGVMVMVCDQMAEVTSVAPTSLTFVTPRYYSVQSADLACDVTVSIETESTTLSGQYTYQVVSTPVITSVSPARGGSQGGTRITITGSNFGSGGANLVTIAGTVCDIESESVSEIVCVTNAPASSSGGVSLSQKSNVIVEVGTLGHSTWENSDYWYVDVWSSTATWGGEDVPTEGDFIVIPDGQLLLLDVDTPILKMILIQGGELLFDEVDLTLRAENILIVDGGKLTVGTEDAPFQHDATIEMHGYLRSPELPIYGAKCLAIREGELNLHGKPVGMTWTRLAATASAGATEIILEWGQADWPVGSTIAIATTGDFNSQRETELRNITAISADGLTVTLDEALEYEHLGVTEQLGGGHTLEMRAEVALLSRNVRVIGSRDVQWSDEIEACPDGFDTGEFATQTCFQGRFGDEIGSDQFGAQIMFHAPVKDTKLAVGKLSYFEVNYAGQAFRLGRYPIHFHLNGDMNGTYVRGSAIHETFNRAINIHGTHNVLIEHNVVYNVMGGALFLEDGIETGNRYLYNLALFVKASSSLLNDDVTPAAFWATNPDNHYEHNAVAGGTHFGFWYRLLEHPEGPSATNTICPRRVPLGTSYNNTVHSNGWFGLWTFQDYYPMVGGGCNSDEPEPAVFERFIVWNCEKGLEFVNGGSLQFVDCMLANNKLTGLEGKQNMKLGEVPYTDRGPMLRDSVVAAYAPNHPHTSGGLRVGVVLPWSAGFMVKNTTFINFDKEEEVVFGMTAIQGTCSELCGGWNYVFEKLSFINGDQNLARFRWLHDGVFVDIDGSYSGAAGNKVLPWLDTMDPSKCVKDSRFTGIDGVEGALCDSTTQWSRFSFNNAGLSSMAFKDVLFINEFGLHRGYFADKRMTHKQGWTTVVQHGQTYKMVWENVEHVTNISYNGVFEDLAGGSVIITHNISSKPDKVSVIGVERDVAEASINILSYDSNLHGDFYFADNEKELSYIVSDQKGSRRKRALGDSFIAENIALSAYKCYWPDCEPPPDQNTLPPIAARPEWAVPWSNVTIWPNNVLPNEDSDVTIASGMWVVADIQFPRLNKLVLEGNLELDHGKDPATNDYRDFTLEVNFLIVLGGRLVVGWPDDRFLGNVEIILSGTQNSDSYPQSTGTPIGLKAIAVYGGLDLHGKQRSPVLTTLAATAQAGSSSITVSQDIDWEVNEEIMVTSTSYDALETEVVTITAVSGREVTFTPALQHRHLGESFTEYYTDREHSLAAEVALLTRNVMVRGGDHADLDRLGFGGRILVGGTTDEDGNGLVGWARVSYTQFKHMGQLGFTEAFDPRYAIAYVQTGPTSSVKPSFLKANSFHSGLARAVGLFGASGIDVQDNVMYRVVGGGMVVFGDDHVVERNLIALNLWTGSYQGRRETKNVAYDANFEMVDAGDIVFKDNIAAGSERAGFRVAGEQCGVENKFEGNRAHAGMFGVMMWEGDEISTVCFQVSGYTAWKNYDFGIFIQSPVDSIELYDNVLMENGVGVWTHTFSPGSLSHIVHLKQTKIEEGLVSGATQWFDCTTDVMPDTVNYELSNLARSWRIDGGMVGFSFPNADGGPNNLPTHPFRGRMSYPAIDAVGYIDGVTVVNYKERDCSGKMVMDYVISTNPSAHDLNHLVRTSRMNLEPDVSKDNLVFYHHASLSKVNPSDCVDMVCDGHRKALLEDQDGNFLGTSQNGFIVDDAANQWDGDARYGVGDYRIPAVMLTFPNGTRMDPPSNKGIHLGSNCVYRDTWQAFECYGDKYRLLVIESMDADTEVRRLSPLALKSRGGNYVDLINGPQDHGWCAGYTCQKRISTFWAVVVPGLTYDLYMTGSNPQHTRFYMLQADNSDRVNLAVYYHSPMRLDVFADDIYIYPSNAEIESDGDYKLLESTQSPSEYIPDVTSDSHGTNYFDRDWQLQYFILRGNNKVDIIIKEVVVVSLSLPPMTVDDFFGEDIVNNLAVFLGVPAEKIRIVNVVRETGKRRKRQESGVTVDIEIGDAPVLGQNVTNVNSGDLNRDTLLNLTRKVVDAVQLGTLGNELNLTILGIEVQEPLPTPENSTSSAWATVSNGTLTADIQIPSEMRYSVELVGEREQQPFPTQPQFEMYDSAGQLVEVLGSRADPWKIRALLSGGHPNAHLIGDNICGFQNGICAFESLGISHSGSGYTISFEIFDPQEASGYAHVSEEITLVTAELSAGFSYVPDKDMPVMIDEVFYVLVDIRDFSSQRRLEDISWANHNWTASLAFYSPELSPTGAMLQGDLQMTFDPATGMANFTNVSINMGGRYFIEATVVSTPVQYTITGRSEVVEVKQNVTMQEAETSYNCTLRSPLDYNMYAAGMEDVIEASVYNYLQSVDPTARYHDFMIYEGSIYIHFWATGEADPLLNIISNMASSVSGGLSVVLPDIQLNFDRYLLVDDSVYSGLDGMTTTTTMEEQAGSSTEGPVTAPPANKKVGIIVGCVIGALVLIAVVAIVSVLIIKKKSSKTDPRDENYAPGTPPATSDPERPAPATGAESDPEQNKGYY